MRGQYYLVQQIGGPQLALGRPPPAQRVSDIARVEGLQAGLGLAVAGVLAVIQMLIMLLPF